jgi:3-methylfumaryl-CoA hydratase
MTERPLSDWIGTREHHEEVIAEFPAQAAAALLERDVAAMVHGGALPALWHWFYFLPRPALSETGPDGHPKRGGFFPPVTLPRRMFAGARTRFLQPLLIGEVAVREAEILDVREKSGRSGPLVFVTVRYRVCQFGNLCLEEEQDIVYREAGSPVAAPVPAPSLHAAPPGAWVRDVTPDSVLLFRFSALTFNGHRIHYDLSYARESEGYPGLVVHGPLTAVLLAGLAEQNSGRRLSHFEFRGRSPLFLPHPFRLIGQAVDASVSLEVRAVDGQLALEASAELAGPMPEAPR